MDRAIVVLGFVLHVAMGVVILVSGLIMPAWAVGVLAALWVVTLVAAIGWRDRPGLVITVPIATFAIWLAAAWAGDRFLDWTA